MADTRATRGGSRRVVLVGLGLSLLLVGLVLGFAVTALGAARTGELGLDVSISHHRTSVLTALALAVNIGLGPLVAPIVLLVACGILWTRNRFAAVAVGGLTVVGWLSVELGKLLVHRIRPPAASVHALVSETAADSYPSGHTAFAAATVFAIAATLVVAGRPTRLVWLVGLPLVALVGLSRLYLGVHYLTDVVASVVFAGASVLVVAVIGLPWLTRRGRREMAVARADPSDWRRSTSNNNYNE